jgi:hypothetical protein
MTPKQEKLLHKHIPTVENKLVKQQHSLAVRVHLAANLSKNKPALQEQQPVAQHLTLVLQAQNNVQHNNKVKY